jgi:TfoX/Sxy family transcriptional regulator of competence genes
VGAWEKASRELTDLLEHALAGFDQQRRMMFGGPAHFVNGTMFAAVHARDLVIRLAEDDRSEISVALPGVRPFEPMPGKPMREYVVLPEEVHSDPARLHEWLDRSHAYAASLPPKAPKVLKAAPRPRKPPGP